MWGSGRRAAEVVEAEGLTRIDDAARLEAIVREVVAANPKPVAQFKGGQDAGLRLLRRAGDEGDAGPGESRSWSTRSCAASSNARERRGAILAGGCPAGAGTPSGAARPNTVIEIDGLSKRYARDVFALHDVTMRVERGEFAFLTGAERGGEDHAAAHPPPAGGRRPSGASSWTAGTWPRSEPADVQRYRRAVGFVFQDFKLIPRKTVFENVMFALRILGVPDVQQRRRTFQVLKWVGLQHRANAYPMELSGGEQQRVAIARALVNEPVLVLADEPTGNLDPDLALEIMNLFREMNAGGTTVLVATHDRELIRHVGRRAIALDHGRVVESA